MHPDVSRAHADRQRSSATGGQDPLAGSWYRPCKIGPSNPPGSLNPGQDGPVPRNLGRKKPENPPPEATEQASPYLSTPRRIQPSAVRTEPAVSACPPSTSPHRHASLAPRARNRHRLPTRSVATPRSHFDCRNVLILIVAGQQYGIGWLGDPRFLAGLAIFLVGLVLNIHSDNIRLRLRKPDGAGRGPGNRGQVADGYAIPEVLTRLLVSSARRSDGGKECAPITASPSESLGNRVAGSRSMAARSPDPRSSVTTPKQAHRGGLAPVIAHIFFRAPFPVDNSRLSGASETSQPSG